MSKCLHPNTLIDAALRMLRFGKNEPYELDAASANKLTAQLAQIADAAELYNTVVELCTFAGWLAAEKKSPGAAEVLFGVAETAIAALQRIPGDRVSPADVVADARGKLLDAKRPRLDPQPAPEGSIASGPLARFHLLAKRD